jgi:hypothetical protein
MLLTNTKDATSSTSKCFFEFHILVEVLSLCITPKSSFCFVAQLSELRNGRNAGELTSEHLTIHHAHKHLACAVTLVSASILN